MRQVLCPLLPSERGAVNASSSAAHCTYAPGEFAQACVGAVFDRSVGERFLNTADHQHITAILCEIPALDRHDNGHHASTLHSTAVRAPLDVLHRRLTQEALWAVNQATNLSSVGQCHPPRHPCPPDTMLKAGGVAKTSAAGGRLIVQHCLRGEGVRRQEETELKFVDWWMGISEAWPHVPKHMM